MKKGFNKPFKSSIGKVFPFFIGNPNLKNYYLYQVVSPKLNEKCKPLLTFTKLSERVGEKDYSASFKYMNHGDVLATLLRSRKNLEKKAIKYLKKDVLSRYFDNNEECPIDFYENGMDFPMFDFDNNTVKMLVVGIRDNLRWNRYRLQPDTEVDILISPTQFGIFEVKGDKESIKLNFKAAYNNIDVERRNPLNVNVDEIQYPKDEFKGEKRASELNKAIRNAELKAFDTEEF